MVVQTPAFKLLANGVDITATIKPYFLELSTVDDAKDDSDAFDLVLVRDSTLQIPNRGARLNLALGWEDAPLIRVGQYVVDEREIDEVAKTVVIRCKGTPFNVNQHHKQMQSQKTQAWASNPLGVVVDSIAKRNGLSISISPSLASIPLTAFYQRHESDLHLLQRLARQYHASFKINGGTLIFQALGSPSTAKGVPLPLHRFNLKELSDCQYSDGGRGEGGSCVARYRLRSQKKSETVVVGQGDPVRRLKGVYPSLVQAQEAAQAHLRQTQKSSRRLSLRLPYGDASLFALHQVVLTGTSPPISGENWQIIRVTHQLDFASGFTTRLDCEGV